MKTLFKFHNVYITIAAIFASLFVFLNQPHAMVYDRVVAKVNSEIVTMSAVYEREQPYRHLLGKSGEKIPPRDQLLKQILDTIIEEKLQIQHGKKIGIQVDESRVEDALNDVKESNGIDEKQLAEMLKREGKSIEQYKTQIRNQLIMSQVARYQFGRGYIVKDSLIKKYYDRTKKEYWIPGKIKVRHILFILDEELTDKEIEVKRKRAELVLKEIRSGKPFEEMARKYSEDVSASSGGEIGTLQKGKMVAEFDKAAFALPEGGISGIVKTQFGYHILKVDKKFPGYTKPLDDKLKEKIKNKILKKITAKKYKEWVKQLRKNAFIEVKLFEDDSKKDTKMAEKPKAVASKKSNKPSRPQVRRSKKRSRVRAEKVESSQSASRKNAAKKRDLETLKKKLRYYKKLRDNKRISEEKYQKKKKELLAQF